GDAVEEQRRAAALGLDLGERADLEVPVRAVEPRQLAQRLGRGDEAAQVVEAHGLPPTLCCPGYQAAARGAMPGHGRASIAGCADGGARPTLPDKRFQRAG